MILCEERERALPERTADFSLSVASFPHAWPHLTLMDHLLCASDKEQDRPYGFESMDSMYC